MTPGYHSPTHSFYYGRESTCNYKTGHSANTGTLTSPPISGLSASATLSFYYWRQVEYYPTGSFDKTYVQASYDGGVTWSTVWYEDSKNASENAWTLASVPLTPSAGTAQVRFVFDTVDGTANNYRGWLVDDVTVQATALTLTPTPLSAFFDSFEGSVSAWTATGLWQLATNTACVTPGYHSPTHSFYYGQESTCNYNTGLTTSGTLTSPPISGLAASATLSFYYWRQVEYYPNGSYDRTYVQISYDGGATWSTIWYEDSKTASQNAWTLASVPITPSAGTARVRFGFDSVDAIANNYRGWLIDDVSVTNP